MKQTELLRLQLAILMLQHGERAILESIASLRGQDTGDLEAILIDIDKIRHTRTKKPPVAKTPSFSIESVLRTHPEKADVIRSIQTRYEDKTFLTELKDVRRFLDRHGQPTNTLKTRSEAFAKVVRVLIELPIPELEVILSNAPSDEFSGLGVISDQILRRK